MGISIFLDCVWHISNVQGEALPYEDSFECDQEKRQGQVKFCDLHLKGCRWNNEEEWGPALHGVSLSLVAFMWLPWKVLRWHFLEIAQLFGMITGSQHLPEKKLCLAHWPTVTPCPARGRHSWPCYLPRSRSLEIWGGLALGCQRDWPSRTHCEGGTWSLLWGWEWTLMIECEIHFPQRLTWQSLKIHVGTQRILRSQRRSSEFREIFPGNLEATLPNKVATSHVWLLITCNVENPDWDVL